LQKLVAAVANVVEVMAAFEKMFKVISGSSSKSGTGSSSGKGKVA